MIAYEQKQITYDDKLPALLYATNDAWMSKLFNSRPDILRLLGLCAPINIHFELLKYTPGKRCVIGYELRNSSEIGPRYLIGKLYRDDRGAAVFERMMSLWHNGLRGKMARPLHYFSALGMVLQFSAPGRSLADIVMTKTAVTLPYAIETAAHNLAQLHATPVAGLPIRRHMSDHLAKYCRPHPRQLSDALAAEHPDVSRQVTTILDALTGPATLENAALCTVHNDLNLAHIYWKSGNAVFIDLDGLCRSHSELDLATFRVALHIYLGDQGKMLGKRFLEAYLAAGGITAVNTLRLYESFVYLRRATICYRKREQNRAWLQELAPLLENSLHALPT